MKKFLLTVLLILLPMKSGLTAKPAPVSQPVLRPVTRPAATRPVVYTIDCADGIAISPWIRGQTRGSRPPTEAKFSLPKTLEISRGASLRGMADGLFADTYNWKTRSGYYVGDRGQPNLPVLQFLREARDLNAAVFLTVNIRGIGNDYSWDFLYTNRKLEVLKTLAADWVRYTNNILQHYDLNHPPTAGEDLRIYNEIANWETKSNYNRILKMGEDRTEKVLYWEIGNEPEVQYGPIEILSPIEYRNRYVAIISVMRAQDPSIKVGPCVTLGRVWDNDTKKMVINPQLKAVLDCPAPVDFISYHPYGSMGTVSGVKELETYLHDIKANQTAARNYICNAIKAGGRDPAKIDLVASEWNPSHHKSVSQPAERRMAQALAVVETIFTFAELKLKAAHYFIYPADIRSGTELVGYKAFKGLMQWMGDVLLDSYTDGDLFRVYTTRDTKTGQVAIWGLNFSNESSRTASLRLINLNLADRDVVIWTLGNLKGSTTLTDTNEPGQPATIDWKSNPVVKFDPSAFMLTVPKSTIRVMVIGPKPKPTTTTATTTATATAATTMKAH